MIGRSNWWRIRTVGLLGVLWFFTGCGTIFTLADDAKSDCHENLLYSGTRESATNIHFLFDTPFSLVADTIVLPYTIPRTIWNYFHRPTSDWNVEECLREYRHLPPKRNGAKPVPKQPDTP